MKYSMMRTETQLLFKKSKQINLSLQKNFTENFTEKQKQLIAIVMENPAITTEISNLMGCSRTTVLKNLAL